MFENLSDQKKINLFLIFSAVFLIVFIYQITKPDDGSGGDKFTIADIKASFDGTIIKKVDLKKNVFSFVKILRKNKFDTLVNLGEYVDSINIGDRIIKQKNSPFFYAVDKEKNSRKYIFTLIPERIFNNDKFLQAWKDSCKGNWKDVVIHEKNFNN
ncbi:hypothetical protein [Chryseobacterium sediminis]|uniref:Uncharacterized protein n=1 Tax=Chryseobacterium sediminis TaxID=1679494 RepID=A0A5B2U1Z8_9FLAO|nr:hypothetical protein [Chryseobacterium sediminis]KAA2220614.1 hypothetical protein FW780_17220 [Chryseobacterium sediminis]